MQGNIKESDNSIPEPFKGKLGIIRFIENLNVIILLICLFVMVSGFIFLIFSGKPGSGYYVIKAGFLQGFADPTNYSMNQYDKLFLHFLTPLILTLFNLNFLHKRMYRSLVMILILQIAAGFYLKNVSLVFNLFFLLLLVLNKDAKLYFKLQPIK